MMNRIMEILFLIFITFSFLSCANDQINKAVHKKSDSLKTAEKKPADFESIQQKEWEEHRKDSLQKNYKNSDTIILKHENPPKK